MPAKLPALKNKRGKAQESKTGFYPHAGLFSMFHYLRRYPTTETNRNRLRARMYYQHFLGINIMELADQVADAAAIAVKYATPWMEAADCVVCQRSIDPVAGVFQEAGKHPEQIEEIYGGLNGIFGILHENLIDLNEEKARTIEELKHTPAAALGAGGSWEGCIAA